MHADVLKTSIL